MAFTPYSPAYLEQLVKADRKLTPQEQEAVSSWQEMQADSMQADEEAKGGPKASMPLVSRRGAIVTRPAVPQDVFDKVFNRPLWQLGLGVAGIFLVGIGLYKLSGPMTTKKVMLRYAR